MLTRFYYVFISLIFLFSCTKKEDGVDTLSISKQHLTANRWKISTTEMVTATGNQPQTITNCRKDNLWEYKSDGTFAIYPGSVLCTTGETTKFGTWELLEGGKLLKVTITGSGSYTDEVKAIEAGKLQLTFTTGNVYIDTYISN